MKKVIVLWILPLLALSVFGQQFNLKQGLPSAKAIKREPVGVEPLKQVFNLPRLAAGMKMKSKSRPNIVDIIPIGTSANAYGYGYAGGQRTMVWADDDLGAIINIHRMGPGSNPSALSGCLAMDLGTNRGQTSANWQLNKQIYSSNIDTGGPNFIDAARFPQGGIYNAAGNTSLSNAYCAFFAPNLSNGYKYGGYSYGVVNLANQSDSSKHLHYYSPPPFNYIPDGFAINHNGISLMVDRDMDCSSGNCIYKGNLIVWRGIWNSALHDFQYSADTISFPTLNNMLPLTPRVAFSPDGQTAWIAAIGNDINFNDSTLTPILVKSSDAGLTWGSQVSVELDGPTGIYGIIYFLLSNYRITQIFNPPYPNREQILYSTAFDCDLAVDICGNPHIGVDIAVKGDSANSIITSDSTFAVYDIYSSDLGATWLGELLGYPTTFRGTFGSITEDNRINVSINTVGDKLFFTWNDTHVPGITNNNECDIFARGFDINLSKLTKNSNGECKCDNVTFLSDITQEATFQTASYYVFSDFPATMEYTIPIVSEHLTVRGNPDQPVVFEYIRNFYYHQYAFTCQTINYFFYGPCGISVEKKSIPLLVNQNYPNPFTNMTNIEVNLPNKSTLSIEFSNIFGSRVLTIENGFVRPGRYQFSIDAKDFSPGIYFYSVRMDDQVVTKKMIVE